MRPDDAPSANGRPADFDSENTGLSPVGAAIITMADVWADLNPATRQNILRRLQALNRIRPGASVAQLALMQVRDVLVLLSIPQAMGIGLSQGNPGQVGIAGGGGGGAGSSNARGGGAGGAATFNGNTTVFPYSQSVIINSPGKP